MILLVPIAVHAGLLSYVSNLFISVKAEETSSLNSQNIPLLQAPVNVNPHSSLGGGEITIVDGSALQSEVGPSGGIAENQKDHVMSDQISVYVVRDGDSLGTIAKMFAVSINTIRWNNDIKGSKISPGQTLLILPVSGIRHTVKANDTVKRIAKLYKADVADIEQYNNITATSILKVGDVVIVPDGEITPASNASQGVTSRVKFVETTKSYSGYYVRPTTGPRSQGIHGYNGVDIAPPAGTPIIAAADGKVIVSKSGGWNGGYGNYVVIRHDNGTQTLYAHMSKVLVSSGETVEQSQVIGNVGSTGKVTGAHLHFEIRGAKNPF